MGAWDQTLILKGATTSRDSYPQAAWRNR
jgi:hypothetical protein